MTTPPAVDAIEAASTRDVEATSRDTTIAQWCVAAVVMVGSAAAAAVTFDHLGEHWAIGLVTAVGVDLALAMWLLVSRRLRAVGITSPMGRALEFVTAGMTLFLNAGSAAFKGVTGPTAQYLLAFAHCFLPVILVLVGLAGGEAQLKLFHLRQQKMAREKAVRDAQAAADRVRYEADQCAAKEAAAKRDAEAQRIRDEQAAERKAEQDRVNALRETEAKTRQAEAEAAAAAEQVALAEAEAALAAAKAEADKQETARLRAESRAAGQTTGQRRGQTGGQRGGQRRGQAGGSGPDKATPPDVSDLMEAGHAVARKLAEEDRELTRSALVSGLRSAGLSCSTDRAVALLDRLKNERTEQRSDRPLHAVKTASGGGH